MGGTSVLAVKSSGHGGSGGCIHDGSDSAMEGDGIGGSADVHEGCSGGGDGHAHGGDCGSDNGVGDDGGSGDNDRIVMPRETMASLMLVNTVRTVALLSNKFWEMRGNLTLISSTYV